MGGDFGLWLCDHSALSAAFVCGRKPPAAIEARRQHRGRRAAAAATAPAPLPQAILYFFITWSDSAAFDTMISEPRAGWHTACAWAAAAATPACRGGAAARCAGCAVSHPAPPLLPTPLPPLPTRRPHDGNVEPAWLPLHLPLPQRGANRNVRGGAVGWPPGGGQLRAASPRAAAWRPLVALSPAPCFLPLRPACPRCCDGLYIPSLFFTNAHGFSQDREVLDNM